MRVLAIISMMFLIISACATQPMTRPEEDLSARLELVTEFTINNELYSVERVDNISIIGSVIDYPTGEYIGKTTIETIAKTNDVIISKEEKTSITNITNTINLIIFQGDEISNMADGVTDTIIFDKRTRKITVPGIKDKKLIKMIEKTLYEGLLSQPRIVSSGSIIKFELDFGRDIKFHFSEIVQGVVNIADIHMLLYTGYGNISFPVDKTIYTFSTGDLYILQPLYENYTLLCNITKSLFSGKIHGEEVEINMRILNICKKNDPSHQEKNLSEEERKIIKLFKDINI